MLGTAHLLPARTCSAVLNCIPNAIRYGMVSLVAFEAFGNSAALQLTQLLEEFPFLQLTPTQTFGVDII